MICVRQAGAKGRGVFATRSIEKGEVIERAPVVVVPAAEREHLDKTALGNYYYLWMTETEDMAIALGLGSVYNHSYGPNAYYVKHRDELVVEFIAHAPIREGDEITINYNGAPNDQAPLWFDVV